MMLKQRTRSANGTETATEGENANAEDPNRSTFNGLDRSVVIKGLDVSKNENRESTRPVSSRL